MSAESLEIGTPRVYCRMEDSIFNAFWMYGVNDEGEYYDQELCVYFEVDNTLMRRIYAYEDLLRDEYVDDALFTLQLMSGASDKDMQDVYMAITQFVIDVAKFYKEIGRYE